MASLTCFHHGPGKDMALASFWSSGADMESQFYSSWERVHHSADTVFQSAQSLTPWGISFRIPITRFRRRTLRRPFPKCSQEMRRITQHRRHSIQAAVR